MAKFTTLKLVEIRTAAKFHWHQMKAWFFG